MTDILGDPIKGTFYRYEWQKVVKSVTDVYTIEKIIRKKKCNGRKQLLVKWMGWPKKFNSWIDENELKDI